MFGECRFRIIYRRNIMGEKGEREIDRKRERYRIEMRSRRVVTEEVPD